ncbi:MAG: DUF1844 domain-containing protein [Candidatus Omnitrophota bacterium]|jgi:hypothetical protein
MSEEIRKKVDEEWKTNAEKEKKEAHEKHEAYHEPNFRLFLSSLSMQAMIALGRLENPVSGKTDKNLEQARFLVDTIGILKEKTKGNLNPEEEKLLDDSLFSLRMMYVEEKNKKNG